MLLLFVFSITPKKYFHDLIADHIDLGGSCRDKAPVFQDAGFNCHFENLVAESPFTATPELRFNLSPVSVLSDVISVYAEDLSASSAAIDNKGPPALFFF